MLVLLLNCFFFYILGECWKCNCWRASHNPFWKRWRVAISTGTTGSSERDQRKFALFCFAWPLWEMLASLSCWVIFQFDIFHPHSWIQRLVFSTQLYFLLCGGVIATTPICHTRNPSMRILKFLQSFLTQITMVITELYYYRRFSFLQ